MEKKNFKKFIADAKKQYNQIHPKWIYFLLMDLWQIHRSKLEEPLNFIRLFNPRLFRGREGLRALKNILLDYQKELKKRI